MRGVLSSHRHGPHTEFLTVPAPSSGVLPAPPCAVAWTTGAPWPCCAGSMPCWSAWCAGPEAAPWDVVVDSCSVRAKHGGELTGPNPTDRGKPGTKYHVVVATDGLPLGAVPSAANVHDTRLFRHLLHLAQSVGAAIGRLYADAGYDSAENRALCLRHGIQPHIRKIGAAHGSGLGRIRCVVEHDCAWLLANKRLDRRQDRLGRVILALLTAACIFIVANRISAF